MKSAFLVLLLIFTNGIAFTQVESYRKENPSNLKPFVVNLIAEKIAPQNIKLPFSRISIIDNRYDTSKIGFRESFGLFKGKKNSFKKIVLKKGMSKSFEDYYNDFYDKNFTKNGFELVLVFKKFWWSYFGKGNSKKADYALYNPDFLQVHTKCEYYLRKNNQYLPIKRLDTVFKFNENSDALIEELSDEKKFTDLKQILKILVEQYDYTNAINEYEKQKKKTHQEVVEYNSKQFIMPVLRDSNINNGVYKNFIEFKNNLPSTTQFSEKKMNYRLTRKEEYIVDYQDNEISNFWCYKIDNKIKYGDLGHEKLFRVNNTFELFIKVVWNELSTSSGQIPMQSVNRNEIWVPMQIDMDSGLLY